MPRASSAGPSGAGILHLVAIPGFAAVLVAASLVQASHAMIYGFGTLYWELLGLPRWQIGALWAFGVVVEILLFAGAAQALRRISPLQLILVGAAAAVVRWAAFPFLDGFGAFLALQGLHGLTFGATYLGTVHYISAAAPPELAARAQSLYATVGGVAMALAMLVSGPLYGAYSGAGVAAMAGFALLAIVLIVMTPALKRASTRV